MTYLVFLIPVVMVVFAAYNLFDTVRAWVNYVLFRHPVIRFPQYKRDDRRVIGSLYKDSGGYFFYRYPASKIGRERVTDFDTRQIEFVTKRPKAPDTRYIVK